MFTREELENAVNSSLSMAEAAAKLKIHFSTFKKLAVREGLYSDWFCGLLDRFGNASVGTTVDAKLDE